MDTSNAILEAGANEEQTQRHGTRDVGHSYLEENAGPLTTQNIISESTAHNDGALRLNYLRPCNSAGNTQIRMFTESNPKRQTAELKGRQNIGETHKPLQQNNLERRQKIFEEEIIKRVKEIQRYVKSLHLQVKKT